MGTMNPESNRVAGDMSQLTNVLQILSRTSAEIENVWEGRDGADKYFAMLQASIERAESIAAALVKQAEENDGKIRVDAAPARFGTTTDLPSSHELKKVLVVDNDQVTLTLITHILTDAGYEVDCAQSGFQCLDLFSREPSRYDAVILDLAMPFMDGAETFDRLRALAAGVPVILITGFIEQRALSAMYEKGLAGYLRKPFSPAEITACLGAIWTATPAENPSGGITAAI